MKNKIFAIIGLLVGALSGYLYWKFIGCNTGTCAITSSPIISTIYGALMGAVTGLAIQKDKKQTA
ncbi:DUF6132 family protein [Pedobacter psychroterrae]|uniref:YtxH domain-containing protein n=1 Tax=Pedobacter psychroterrae TaxID=2530453 RepID=A0A4R0NMS1_9SPHI|nr:DUF6132 family protein [Pedobacter psychroterrae]TCD01529.1 hypothetical protein EZ437_12395 [Pedobacter psychroterrae]